MISKVILNILIIGAVQICSARSQISSGVLPCPVSCPALVQPICGSDGVTYDNHCQLDLEVCEGSPIYKVADGPCEEHGAINPHCFFGCEAVYIPVCGSDGKTYGNECALNRTICQDPTIFKVNDGKCVKSKKEECHKLCSLTDEPVCGSDGITYTNECHLDIVACNNSTIFKRADGACDETDISRSLDDEVTTETTEQL